MKGFNSEEVEQLSSMIDKSFKSREGHNKPAKETLERFEQLNRSVDGIKANCSAHTLTNTNMQIDVATMKVDMDYIKKKLDEIVNKIEQVSSVVCGINGNKAEKTDMFLLEKNIKERIDKIEEKTENIEHWRIKMVVVFSIISAIGSFILHFISQKFLK